ncbi:MAG: hypothetical protein ABIJ05_00160 [Patescibacteria group bacterium]
MEVPRIKRLQETRYKLIGDLCFGCHKPTFPPKDVCSECTTEDLLNYKKSGTIYESRNTTQDIQTQVQKAQG